MTRRRILHPALCGLVVAVSLPGFAAGPEPPSVRAPAAEARAEPARQAILEAINALRREAGAPPLALDGAVSKAALAHAGVVARRGSLELAAGSDDQMQELLIAGGYAARRWAESLVATREPVESWIDDWADEHPAELARAMDPELRDLGIGVAKLGELDLFVLLFAAPAAGDSAAQLLAPLTDLTALRREMLAKLNDLRRQKGLKSRLAASTFLDRAAQRHAEDMLARGYFAHASPEGKTARERALREGYPFRSLGENLAEGQTGIDQLLAYWYDSPAHCAILLAPEMDEIGLGMARGRDSQGRFRIVWVLVAGAPL